MKLERLIRCAREDEIMHALLLAGPAGAGKRTFARRLASAYCLGEDAPERLLSCPNYVERSDMPLPVDEVRELVSSTAVQGMDGGRRAIVLIDAHQLSPQSQNALLKALEEPPQGVIWILTGAEAGFLTTVRSRCAIVRLHGESEESAAMALAAEGVEAGQARCAAALADGMTEYARFLAEPEQTDLRMAALDVLETALFAQPPFGGMQALLDTRLSGDDPHARKTALQQRNAKYAVLCWEWMLRDALALAVSGAPAKNADRAALAAKIASRFTISRIQGIIKLTADGEKQLSAGALALQTMDALLARLMQEKEIQP